MRSLSRLSRYEVCRSTASSIPLVSTRKPLGSFGSFPPAVRLFSKTSPRVNPLHSNIRDRFFNHSSPTQFVHARLISTKPLPTNRGPVVRFLYRTFAYTGVIVVAVGCLVVAFFIYDASTYHEAGHMGDCPVSQVALTPQRGGPKNLPIASVLLDDDASDEFAAQKNKPKLVILGTGWGSVALLKQLIPGDYHVTVVSPVNYFLFTPMLPSATVGTLEFRSLVEPIRRIVNRVRGHFLRAEAESIEFSEKLVEVSQTDSQGHKQRFYLPYDKLVIGVGKCMSV